jgi:hypothetical protein
MGDPVPRRALPSRELFALLAAATVSFAVSCEPNAESPG